MTGLDYKEYANAVEALSDACQLLRAAKPNAERGWDLPRIDQATLLAEAALSEMRKRVYRPEPMLRGGWGTRAW